MAGEQGDKPYNYRQLEESRDSYKSQADKWRNMALKRTAQQAGFDPDKGVGKLLLDSFVRDQAEDLDPDKLDESFNGYVEQMGLQDHAQEPGQGSTGGESDDLADQLDRSQSTGEQLRGLSQPNQGEKTLQQQIADAEANGDNQLAQDLSFKLAGEQFAQSARG